MILRGVTIFLQFIKVGGISPKVRQDIRGGGGGGHQKVPVCMSLDESVHNGSLYCCMYFFLTH